VSWGLHLKICDILWRPRDSWIVLLAAGQILSNDFIQGSLGVRDWRYWSDWRGGWWWFYWADQGRQGWRAPDTDFVCCARSFASCEAAVCCRKPCKLSSVTLVLSYTYMLYHIIESCLSAHPYLIRDVTLGFSRLFIIASFCYTHAGLQRARSK